MALKDRIIVCLCGSTRFVQAFQDANVRETLAGKIVLSVGVSAKGNYRPTEQQKEELDKLHKDKIDLAHEILVIDCVQLHCPVHGFREEYALEHYCPQCQRFNEWRPYIGESTRSEIEHATSRGKPVRYLSRELPSRCENPNCNRILPPDHTAAYCSNECALSDA